MKKWNLITLVVLFAVSFQNCSNEFELTEDWKAITIVNGLLDASDTAQYIRVEKAFLDKETSALILAQESDSLYYDDVTVQLQELPKGGGSGAFYILDRVDANLEGYQKEEGVFANSPNYIYKLKKPLVPSSKYRLIVSRDDDDDITAETTVIGAFNILSPNAEFEFRLQSDRSQSFTWSTQEDGNAGDGVVYDLVLRINYTESPTGNPTNTTAKSLDWVISENIRPQAGKTTITHELSDGADFYKFIQRNLDPIQGVERAIVDFDILIYAGGEELLNYVDAGRATSGITSAETLPAYSNISSGIGLFSTRYTQERNDLGLVGSMRDSLRYGPYTSNLGFRGQ